MSPPSSYSNTMARPHYIAIKEHIIEHIDEKRWLAGDRVPSENELAEAFTVSRMTARRALQELCDQGILVRSQGLGSFVADNRPMSSILTVKSIDEEIAARGHNHRAEVLFLEAQPAAAGTAQLLGLREGAEVFRSILLHWENKRPLQYEERFVNPHFGGDYLEQDFTRITPSHYLSNISPITEADQTIEAVNADPDICKALRIKRSDPCLKLSRRTWCKRGIVNVVELIFPGDRYRLGGHLNF